MTNLRNYFHVIGGLILGYGLTLLFGFSNRENFPLSWNDFRTIAAPIVGAVIVCGLALKWELEQDKVTDNETGKTDILISGFSAYLGGIICLFLPNLYVAIILNLVCLVFIYRDYQKWKLKDIKTTYVPKIKIDINSDELTLLLLINQHRESLGLNTLLVEKLACEIASVPTTNKQKSHNGFSERAKNTKAVRCGEICAYGFNNPISTFNSYLKSAKHKAVIENPIYTHIGLSYLEGYNFTIFTKY